MKVGLNKLGIDLAILYVIIGRGWSSISGIITVFLIAEFMTPVEQGFYYTFASILALQLVFELGFGTVIRQFISHEMAYLTLKNGFVKGSKESKVNLFSLIRFTYKWFSFVSIFVFCFITPIGVYFFSTFSSTNEQVFWQLPWFFLVFFTSLSFIIIATYSILEGIGFIADVQKIRLYQSVFFSLLAWPMLYLGYGLYIPALGVLVTIVFGFIWVFLRHKKIIIQAFHKKYKHINGSILWKKDILPLQSKIAVSWVFGYFIFQIITPISFKFFGPEFAGKIGMSLSISNMLLSITLAWQNTKMPYYGRLIAQQKINELNIIFNKSVLQSSVVFSMMSFMLIAIIYILDIINIPIGERVLSYHYFAILLLATFSRHLVGSHACYIRSFKKELHMYNAIITGAFMIVSLLLSALYLPPNFLIIVYLLVMLLFCFPHSRFVFNRFKLSQWLIYSEKNRD